MKRESLFILMLATCAMAGGQTTSTGITLSAASGFAAPIVTCTMKDERHVDKCTMAEGHTLEEVMQSVMESLKTSSDQFYASLQDSNKRTLRCLDIAERENKSLRRCVKGLDDIGHMLQKESGKTKSAAQ